MGHHYCRFTASLCVVDLKLVALDTRVDVHQALRVFQKIQELGTRDDDNYRYKGITATSDYDGYTLILKDDYVTLTILFHSKFKLEYHGAVRLVHFLEQLSDIDRHRAPKKNPA